MVLTTDFSLVNADEYATNPIYKGKPLMNQVFSEQRSYFEYDYDTHDLPLPAKTVENARAYQLAQDANELNRRKRIATTEFWGKHRQIKHKTDLKNGFTPNLPAVAEIEIISLREQNRFRKDKKRVEIFNKVMEMDLQQVYDLALYYKPVLYGKPLSHIYDGLLSLAYIGTDDAFLGGALFQKGVDDDFLQNYDPNNITVSMKTYVSKAVAMGIIVRGTGGLALQNGTFVGKDIDAAVVYFTTDIASYTNIIQPEVNNKSELPENDLDEIDFQNAQVASERYSRKEAQAKKDAEFKTMNEAAKKEYAALGGTKAGLRYTDMVDWIKDKKAELAEIAHNESLPTRSLEIKINPEDTADMPTLLKIAQEAGVKGWAMFKDEDKLRKAIKAVRVPS